MSKINVLSKDISELIAAGEVIERPASVIKELVENSIDAGAKHITVEIKNGGTTFMRIADDGCGMEYDDVPTAFLRHATSKITSKTDLDNILTLGFRGEALASVSAVAKVDVMTKRAEDEYGTQYIIDGSIEKLHEKTGCPDGTTIIIRDLFFNVPVRQKFMKKDVTEANAVSKIVQKTALSHPEVSFKFIRDNKIEFTSSGDGELYSAIYAVYGKDFANDLIPVNYAENNIKISGFVIKPLYSKSNRTFQNFFVNGRYVKSLICQNALESAYDNMIMTGKFPACVLMMEIPPATIDVNIHPAKAEIRFSNEKAVSDAVYFAVKNGMMNNGLIYEFQLDSKKNPIINSNSEPEHEQKYIQSDIFTKPQDIESVEKEISENRISEPKISERTGFGESIIPKFWDSNHSIKPSKISEADIFIEPEYEEEKVSVYSETATAIKENLAETLSESESVQEFEGFSYINTESFKQNEPEQKELEFAEQIPEKSKIRVIGEAFKNYIMAEADDNIIMIDKHAAHERVLFERMKSENCRQYMQMMLDGGKILLSDEEFDAMELNTEYLENIGFSFDLSQKPYIIPKGVPSFLIELNMDEIIPEIAENLVQFRQNPQTHVLDDILHTMACKAAIKANDNNDISELQKLAEMVYNDENIRHCPHGRPVMFTMTKNNIERQFKRKV